VDVAEVPLEAPVLPVPIEPAVGGPWVPTGTTFFGGGGVRFILDLRNTLGNDERDQEKGKKKTKKKP
jgi:hypothetical protein